MQQRLPCRKRICPNLVALCIRSLHQNQYFGFWAMASCSRPNVGPNVNQQDLANENSALQQLQHFPSRRAWPAQLLMPAADQKLPSRQAQLEALAEQTGRKEMSFTYSCGLLRAYPLPAMRSTNCPRIPNLRSDLCPSPGQRPFCMPSLQFFGLGQATGYVVSFTIEDFRNLNLPVNCIDAIVLSWSASGGTLFATKICLCIE